MAATKITVMNNGSLRVEGDFEIVDQEGKTFGLALHERIVHQAERLKRCCGGSSPGRFHGRIRTIERFEHWIFA